MYHYVHIRNIDFIDQIDSQHAFALWIKDKKQLYLSRDHVGIKPLFYSLINNFLVFGSEVRGLLDIVPNARNMDFLAVSCWSLSGLNVTNNSFFNLIWKMKTS